YRVVRFRNSTPFVLEPGPISIYSGDSFVGEGLSESVGTGVSATLPFAVEPELLRRSDAAAPHRARRARGRDLRAHDHGVDGQGPAQPRRVHGAGAPRQGRLELRAQGEAQGHR